jgi:hypothetical protein
MLAFGMLVVGLLAVLVVVLLVMRNFSREEGRLDTELHAPGARTLRYAVPDGQDPAVLVAALSHGGFRSVADLEGGTEVLLVENLHEGDRARVRDIIEHVNSTGFAGAPMQVGHVSFEDER